jgi:serine/threonine protein kinase
MSREELLSELLLQWQEHHEHGRDVSGEALCRDHPELAPELDRRIQVLRHMNRAVEDSRRPALGVLPTLPGYEVVGELGRGGMGVVYQARQLATGRVVAVKRVRDGAHPELLARFRTEAEAVARLQHPHVVQIYEVGEHDGLPYFAMEYADGGTLAQRLTGEPWPAAQAVPLVEALANAVQYAHERGIVHRDLKPANILFSTSSTNNTNRHEKDKNTRPPLRVDSCYSWMNLIPKITDFGLARQLDSTTRRTQSGAVLGTPAYMAPEQALGLRSRVGPQADVFGLGALLYELLTGRPPYRGATARETWKQARLGQVVPPRRLNPHVPPPLERICLKALEAEPARRYVMAGQLAADLRRYRRRPLRLALGLGLAGLLALAVGILLYVVRPLG